MVVHERTLYLSERPDGYRVVMSPIECRYETSTPLQGESPDGSTQYDLIVFHPERPYTIDEALARIRELLLMSRLGRRPVTSCGVPRESCFASERTRYACTGGPSR